MQKKFKIITVAVIIALAILMAFIFLSKKTKQADNKVGINQGKVQVEKNKPEKKEQKAEDVGVFIPVMSPDENPTDEFGEIFSYDIDVEKDLPYIIMLYHHFGTPPVVAVGYDYSMGANDTIKFASVTLPNNGDGIFDLYLYDGSDYKLVKKDLASGTKYDFETGGVSRFRVLGITPNKELKNPSISNFLTKLTFTGQGEFKGVMTPIIEPYQ